MNKQIHNVETGEVTIVPLTDDEIAAQQALGEKTAKFFADKATAKSNAEAKLAALGLTTDDLKALGL